MNLKSKLSTITAKGLQTTRFVEDKTKLLKKSVSQSSADINKILKKDFKITNENKDPQKNYPMGFENLLKKESFLLRLNQAPTVLPLVTSKFFQSLCKLENRLANFYLYKK